MVFLSILYFDKQEKCFMWISHFIAQNVKKMCIQGLKSNKIIFTALRAFLGETGLKKCWCMAVTQWLLVHLMLLSQFFLRHEQFCPSLFFQHQCKCQHSEKSKQCLFLFPLIWNSFDLSDLWKSLRDSEGSAEYILRTSTLGHHNTKIEKRQ